MKILEAMLERIKNEPVLTAALVAALLLLLVEFGLELTGGQQAAVQGVVAAFGLWLARRSVTPTRKIDK